MGKRSYKIFNTTFQSIFFVILLSAHLPIFGQSAGPDILKNQFDQYNKSSPQEKVFVHTDKDLYLAGEILWFKIYYVNAATNKPLNLTRVAYIEVLDKDHKSVLNAKVAINEGSGSGSLYLPVSLHSGNFQVRAYTAWMQNFDAGYYFTKNITLVNSLEKPDNTLTGTPPAYDVQFFPEGGNLVEGMPAKVAFRAIDQNGKGVDFKGALINSANDTLVRFQPLKFGIGTFSFTPPVNTAYKAVISIVGSKPFSKDLPAVYKTGYIMQVSEIEADKIRVNIQANVSSGAEALYLFIHTRQEIKITEMAGVINGKAEFVIDKSSLGEGISHITLFNSSRQPVCERLYFKRPSQKLTIETGSLEREYSTRKQINISFSAKDESGQASQADLSMAVFPAADLEVDGPDIMNYLWLGSDLKGNVESPGYYFSNNNPQTNEALDNLMLTHGWRRFVWEDVLRNEKPLFKFIPEAEGHVITGKVTNIKTGAPAANILTYLSVPGSKIQLYGARSNSAGELKYYTKDFFGTGGLVAQTDYQQDSIYRIDINNPFSEELADNKMPEFNLSDNLRSQLLKQSLSAQVQNVYAGDKLKLFYPPLVDSNEFYLNHGKQYLLDNYTRFKTTEEVFREYVPEISVTRLNKDYNLTVLVQPYYFLQPRITKPLILFDGVPVFDSGNKVIAYDPMKIRKLEVVPNKYFLGPIVFNSLISLTTYKGDLLDFKLDPRATVMDYEGMQLNREFYSPVYESQVSNRVPDFRNVLYWTPDIKLDANSKTISFYTSDQENKYVVIIQGLNPAGRAGVTMLSFDVKR